jgi:Zn-dependent membrane protease YugP
MWYWILFIGIALVSYIVQANLKSKFKRYSKMPIDYGLTGRELQKDAA